MLYAYVAAAIVGSVLLGASLAGAEHGHEVGHGLGHDADGPPPPVFALLSVRVWTYVLAFGGVTGAVLRYAFHTGEPAAALSALSVGLAAGAMARLVVGRAAARGRPGTSMATDFVGRSARVVVPAAPGGTGKVRARIADADVDMLATLADDGALEQGEDVLVVEVRRDGTAVVARSPVSQRTH